MKKDKSEKSVFATLPFLVNSQLSIEKLRVAAQVRQSHLKLQNRTDTETDELVQKLNNLEEYIDKRVATMIVSHPAYYWFSNIKGIGKENIGKVVGFIDISKAPHISSLWKFAGMHVVDGKAPRLVAGSGPLEFNKNLRSMLWRMGNSMLKAGIRYFCVKCGEQRPPKTEGEIFCTKCGANEFTPRAISKFAEYYHKEKNVYFKRFTNEGKKIVKASELPKKNGKMYESDDMISLGHLHNMALRKMLKLFLSCLWLVWREAEGLPITEPYALEKLGHAHKINPSEMVDKKMASAV